jgi:hypothetical protein
MNRDQLLQLASRCQFSQGISLAIAKDVRTSDDVDRARATVAENAAKAKARAKAFCRLSLSAAVACVTSILACWLDFLPAGPETALLGVCLMAVAIGAFVGKMISDCTHLDLTELDQKFAPVVNSSNCKSALEYVQAGQPAVLAWRDLAIAEREVLRVFDVMVMRDLHFASIEAEKEAAQQRENEDACRQLYGTA